MVRDCCSVPLRNPLRFLHQARPGPGQRAHACHLGVAVLEIEDGEVFGQSLDTRRPRDGCDAVLLNQPAQRDLYRAAAVARRNGLDHRIAGDVAEGESGNRR